MVIGVRKVFTFRGRERWEWEGTWGASWAVGDIPLSIWVCSLCKNSPSWTMICVLYIYFNKELLKKTRRRKIPPLVSPISPSKPPNTKHCIEVYKPDEELRSMGYEISRQLNSFLSYIQTYAHKTS